MHRLLFALVAVGFTVSVIAATPATPVDPMPAIVRDFDAYARQQDPIRAADRGDLEAARRWPDDSCLKSASTAGSRRSATGPA